MLPISACLWKLRRKKGFYSFSVFFFFFFFRYKVKFVFFFFSVSLSTCILYYALLFIRKVWIFFFLIFEQLYLDHLGVVSFVCYGNMYVYNLYTIECWVRKEVCCRKEALFVDTKIIVGARLPHERIKAYLKWVFN